MTQALTPVLKDSTLYLGDNGACYCGEHSGTSARFTGRDISGQAVYEVTAREAADHGLKCERCGR